MQHVPTEFQQVASICTATEIEIGGKAVLGVADHRDLHAGLGVRDKHSDWIKRRIRDLGLKQGIDFQSFSEKSENPQGGAPSVIYRLTLDAAKTIAMAEKTDQGALVRRYFLWCEKVAQEKAAYHERLESPAFLRQLLTDYCDKVLELQPKADALDRLAAADGDLCITDAAKALNQKPRTFFAWLSANKWIYRRAGCAHWVGYQDKTQRGYVAHNVTEITRPDGSTKITEQARITAKGLAKLAETFSAPEAMG